MTHPQPDNHLWCQGNIKYLYKFSLHSLNCEFQNLLFVTTLPGKCLRLEFVIPENGHYPVGACISFPDKTQSNFRLAWLPDEAVCKVCKTFAKKKNGVYTEINLQMTE